ncbi:MAG TPA: glycosyltransferase [Candidatus Ozemobacteraceae bacterium]|nr:glycosyltransferase [Candidatus Ozemobacteraceae bacterium]
MNGSFRLLFIVTSLAAGGAERSLLRLCGELAARGHTITLVSLQHRNDYSREIPTGIRLVRLLPDHIRLRRGLLFCLHRLCREAAGHDLVVAGMEGVPCLAGAAAARIARKPFIAWIHTMLSEHAADEWGGLFTRLHRLAMRQADSIVGVSNGVTTEVRRFCPVLDERMCETIYNMQNTSVGLLPHQKPARPASGIPVVLAAGRIRLQLKGLDLLVAAHACLIRSGCLHRLVIVGDGPDRLRLLEVIRELGVEATVDCPGFEPEIEKRLAAADLFVLSSRREGLPRTLLEAMAQGVPIVAADCPSGPREILLDGLCGRLVPPGDSVALSEAIREMLASPDMRRRYVEQGLARIRDFSPERVVPRWEALFARLTSRTSCRLHGMLCRLAPLACDICGWGACSGLYLWDSAR